MTENIVVRFIYMATNVFCQHCVILSQYLEKGLQLKSTIMSPFFLWLIKSEKLVNDRLINHLEKCGLFSDFQYGFRSSQSNVDFLTVVSDRIARAIHRAVTL